MNGIILQKEIAYQCAPLWLDIKLGNTLIISSKFIKNLNQLLLNTRIHYAKLGYINDKILFLLYDKEQLDFYLHSQKTEKFLQACGYKERTTEEVLIHLAKRYKAYYEGKREFPHELGVFLGYPIEDIIGFMENNGKNYLFSGCWKVYNKNFKQKELFYYYKEARKLVLYLLDNGINLNQMIQK